MKRREMNLIEGTIFDKVLLFVIPLALTSLLQQLFNSADIAVVGKFAGKQALAAVGSNGPLINLIINVFVGLSTGANATIARCIGEGDREKVRKAVDTSVTIALISGFVLIAIGEAAAPVLLRLIDTPDDVIGYASTYLRIYFLAMPFIMLYNFGAAILRSKGDVNTPLFCLLFSGVLNVVLNLVFVIAFHMAVVGVALATFISSAASCLMLVFVLLREEYPYRVSFTRLGIDREALRSIVRIGVPSGISGMCFSLSNLSIMSAVNSFGSAASAGNTTALNFDSFTYFIISAFSQATVTFVSQNYGAGKMDRTRKVYNMCALTSLSVSMAISLLYLAFRNQLVLIFTSDPAVIDFAVRRMKTVLLFQCFTAVYEVAGSALRGLGYSMLPSVIVLFWTCLFRLFWVYAVFPYTASFESLMAVYPFSWGLTSLFMLFFYFRYRNRGRMKV